MSDKSLAKDMEALEFKKPETMLRLEYISCPLCGCAQSIPEYTSTDVLCGVPGSFSLARCAGCQHRFMNPRPAPESLGDCYPPHYGPHQPAPEAAPVSASDHGKGLETRSAERPLLLRIFPLRHVPGLKAFYQWLLDDRSQPVPVPMAVANRNSKPVTGAIINAPATRPQALELGCANGSYLARLEAAGWTTVGIEPAVKPARAAKEAGLNVICGLLESVELPPESFDLTAAWMVIEHVPDPAATLRNLFQLLKPGGHLLFSIPNAGCLEAAVFRRNWYGLELPRHLHHFTPRSITSLLIDCGFHDIVITQQRNQSYLVGSIGLVIHRWLPKSRPARWLLHYPDHPTLPVQILLAPLAHLMALFNQSGRLTVSARRPLERRTL